MTPEERAAFVRAETAAIYGACTKSTVSRGRRHAWEYARLRVACRRLKGDLPTRRKRTPRVRVTMEQRTAVETAVARTGSIAGAMAETGCSYEVAQRVLQRMSAA